MPEEHLVGPMDELQLLKDKIARLESELAEHQKTEANLRASAEKYRMIFEHSPLGILHFDQNGVITACNENFVRILGSSKDQLIGLNMLTDLRDHGVIDAVRTALKGSRGHFQGKYQAVTSSSAPVVRCEFSPLLGGDHGNAGTHAYSAHVTTGAAEQTEAGGTEPSRPAGHSSTQSSTPSAHALNTETSQRETAEPQSAHSRILGGIGLVEDITERTNAERTLEESEHRYRQLVESATDIIYQTDEGGHFTLVNPVAIRITEYSSQELMGTHFTDLLAEEHRESIRAFYVHQLKTGLPHTYCEIPVITKSGRRIWLGQNVLLVTNEDRVEGFQAIARDVTDRKHSEEALRTSEEKYRTIVETIEEGYYEVDLRGDMLFFNEQLLTILGYERHELLGMNYSRYMDAQNAQQVFQTFNMVYTTGEPAGMFAWELITKQGMTRDIEASVSLMRAADGQPAGFRGICRDVTERKRADEKIRRAERVQAIAELATGVAHNFNNLLQIVMGNAQLGLERAEHEEKPDLRPVLQRILDSSRSGSETVKRLQSFAHLRFDDHEPAGTTFDLSEVTAQASEIGEIWWKTIPERSGIQLDLVTALTPECFVHGNEHEIFEVIVNLVKNAVEALPRGGTITLSTLKREDQVVLQVSDDGVGIPKDIQGRIFEPFFSTKGVESAGLGLAGSFGIVRRHDGEIAVTSEPGEGSTFSVTLSAARPADNTHDLPAPEPDPVESSVSGLRILVIDDVEALTLMLKEGLSELGHTVLTATSGREGLEIAQVEHLDVVLCDLGMPEMNGWDVGEKMLQLCRDKGTDKLPFVLLTGWGGQMEQEGKMHKAGVDRIEEKPVNLHDLVASLEDLVRAGKPASPK